MNTVRASFALLILAVLSTHSVAEMNPREVLGLVEECVDEETSDQRREELQAQLKDAPPQLLSRSISRFLRRKEAKAALELATECKVPGLSKRVWRIVDDEPEAALDYLFQCPDEGVMEELIETWSDRNTDSELPPLLTERFCEHWVRLELLDEFRNTLTDEVLAEDALRILRYQLLDDDASAETLDGEWNARMRDLSHRAKQFPLEHSPLFELDWNLSAAKPLRQNYSLPQSSRLSLNTIPEKWLTGHFNLRIRICPNKSEEVVFQAATDKGAVKFEYKDGNWDYTLDSGESARVTVPANSWAELELRVQYKGVKDGTHIRECQLFVDGKRLQLRDRHIALDGELEILELLVMEGGPAFCGGGEWW